MYLSLAKLVLNGTKLLNRQFPWENKNNIQGQLLALYKAFLLQVLHTLYTLCIPVINYVRRKPA